MSDQLAVRPIEAIPGMFVVDLILHGDSRGWFKENYQREKLEALGLPHFEAVQNNFSYNAETGVIRGLHAEPWEKYISMAYGKVFGAWVDLRKGDSFGKVFTMEITPEVAVFVPRGVANGYQTLEDNVTYTYLVSAHWSADAQYASLNLYDPALGINWPIGQDKAIISEKDPLNPMLADVQPMEF
ncbi:dTDP-4-dehydrorhamnose 3,5-epimerase [Candidatus Saccharibacteria bacterium CG_4_10_14_0_2_um_filter_52_9]|nr:MAG: dTDP-4-dehydrorhamnose 3,5-epimerase [Candidatus Saccharibacteria bacterium CG_4_10_14_0_2_um_filter_52_9]